MNCFDSPFYGVTIVGALKNAIRIDAFYGYANPSCGSPPKRVPPLVENITLANIISTGSNLSLHLAGLADVPTTGVRLINVSLTDRTFANCFGGVQGEAVNVTPTLPAACGLKEGQAVHHAWDRSES